MKLSSKFIKATDKLCGFENHVPAPYLRKKFSLEFKPKKAEITICGLGFYKLYINGKDITKGAVSPYMSNTDHLCYYDNYDISQWLNAGENAIGIILGNGFRNPFGGFVWEQDKAPHRGPLCCALCLEAENDDNKFELEADESFKTHPSPILFDDFRMGYYYDARLEIPDWNKVEFDDSNWDNAKIEPTPVGEARLCEVEPIVVTEELKPVLIEHFDELPYAYEGTAPQSKPIESTIRKNVYVYDFGVNNAGVTKLKINGKPGQKIRIIHGEHLINGKFAVNTTTFTLGDPNLYKRYLDYGQSDVFICKGGEEEFIPEFKYDGFRYAYVEGLEPEQATEDALTYLVLNSDIEPRAGFECSDNVLNKLWECTRRSTLSNFHYFPTDCPHREKSGWTGDISVSAEHILLNLKAEKSLKEWLSGVRKAQTSEGAFPGIVPTGTWGYADEFGPAWDSVCTILPYNIYKFNGDKSVIYENAEMIMRYLRFVANKRNDCGLLEYGWGDWMDPFQEEKGYITAPVTVTSGTIVYDMAVKAEFMFNEIGKVDEAQYARNFADELREAIRKELIDFDTMTVAGDCQTSQAMALEIGIFNDDEKAMAQKRLIEIVHRDGDINTCGMLGLRYIFHALINAGEADLAYKVITSKSRTCYGHWIEDGATTLYESFKPLDCDHVDSRNHHFLGDISSVFAQEFAGLKVNPTATDTTHFEISPKLVTDLTYAQAYYDYKTGRVIVRWDRTGEGITLTVKTAPDTHGEVIAPIGYVFADGKKTVEWQGEKEFDLKLITA